LENTNDKISFHLYWHEGLPFGRKQLLPIKSFLCTQDLECCELIIWSNVNLSKNIYLHPYLEFLCLRIWDPVSQAIGSPLENRLEYLLLNDSKNYLGGDLFRLLCLHNYGGVYADFDIVFRKCFKPLLGQNFMYQWGRSLTKINGAVIHLYKQSKLAKMLLEELAITKPTAGTTSWSEQLYRRVINRCEFTVFPSGFFNPEWQVDLQESRAKGNTEFVRFIENAFVRTEYSQTLYRDAFAWHWHNRWLDDIEIGSKWWIMEQIYDSLMLLKYGIQNDSLLAVES